MEDQPKRKTEHRNQTAQIRDTGPAQHQKSTHALIVETKGTAVEPAEVVASVERENPANQQCKVTSKPQTLIIHDLHELIQMDLPRLRLRNQHLLDFLLVQGYSCDLRHPSEVVGIDEAFLLAVVEVE